MSHDFLNDFQIALILTKPGTECVAKIVNGEVPDQDRWTFFFLSPFSFFVIAGRVNPFQRTGNVVGTQKAPKAGLENESAVTINDFIAICCCKLYSARSAFFTSESIGIIRMPAFVFGVVM